MCCHDKHCISLTWVVLHLMALITLGTVLCLKDTKTGKRMMKKARRVGEDVKDAVSDAFDMK